jgi:hypothetical protein
MEALAPRYVGDEDLRPDAEVKALPDAKATVRSILRAAVM